MSYMISSEDCFISIRWNFATPLGFSLANSFNPFIWKDLVAPPPVYRSPHSPDFILGHRIHPERMVKRSWTGGVRSAIWQIPYTLRRLLVGNSQGIPGGTRMPNLHVFVNAGIFFIPLVLSGSIPALNTIVSYPSHRKLETEFRTTPHMFPV
jgi:hypothetical protein